MLLEMNAIGARLVKALYKKGTRHLVSASIMLALSLPASAQQVSRSAPNTWISLGYSSLELDAVDWNFERSLLDDIPGLMDTFGKKAHIAGIIVPVFDNGECFYKTNIALFQGQNTQAANDQRRLHALIEACRSRHIPIYLGINVLGWHKRNNPGEPAARNIFEKYPDLEEIPGSDASPLVSVRYASPFSPKVLGAIDQLLREIGTNFPEIAGIAMNVRLSNEEILGFSPIARSESVKALSIDPIDLGIVATADEVVDQHKDQWVKWRKERIMSLVRSVSGAYRKNFPAEKILLSGSADYYTMPGFNDVRSGQDWKQWSAFADAMLIEGRWLPRFNDVTRMSEAEQAAKQDFPNTTFVRMSLGDGLISDENYAKDWAAITATDKKVSDLGIVIRDKQDLAAAHRILEGDFSTPSGLIQVGEIFPDWSLTDASNHTWSSKYLLGKSSYTISLYPAAAAGSDGADTESITADATASRVKLTVARTDSAELSASEAVMPDPSGSVATLLNGQTGSVVVDSAGFIRNITLAHEPAPAEVTKSLSHTGLKLGESAPDFSVPDDTGRVVSLGKFIGKKNVLLTFFPKCFTGGCVVQLGSLGEHYADFKAANTEIFAISVDPADMQSAYARLHEFKFDFVPDTGRNLSMLYGAAQSQSDLASKLSVLIDKNGIVRLIDTDMDDVNHGPEILGQIDAMGLSR